MMSDEELQAAVANLTNPDTSIRSKSFDIVQKAGEKCFPALLELLLNGNDREQDIALAILWNFFRDKHLLHPDTSTALLKAVKTTLSPLVQADGLGFLGDILERYPNRAIQNELISLLYAQDWTIREYAAENLGDIRDIQAIPHLALLLEDEDTDVVEAAQRALQQMQHPAADFALQEWQQRQ